jgi:hypothetical protein
MKKESRVAPSAGITRLLKFSRSKFLRSLATRLGTTGGTGTGDYHATGLGATDFAGALGSPAGIAAAFVAPEVHGGQSECEGQAKDHFTQSLEHGTVH